MSFRMRVRNVSQSREMGGARSFLMDCDSVFSLLNPVKILS